MAGISEIRDLEARKRALVTESEICRETLKGELQNLAHYGAGLSRRIERVRKVGPWLLLGLPALAPLLGILERKRGRPANSQPRSRLKRSLASALLAFRLYRKYSPMVHSLVSRLTSRHRTRAEERNPAANI